MRLDCHEGMDPKHLPGSVTSYEYPPGYATMNDPSSFQCGDIVWGPDVVPSLDPNNQVGTKHVGYTVTTGPISAKMRPFILLSMQPNHALSIPMCTHSGTGDAPIDGGDNYVPVLNPVDAQSDRWRNAKHLHSEYPFNARVNTVAHINEPCALYYHYPLKKEGNLTDKSILYLHNRFQQAFYEGTEHIRRLEQELGMRADRMENGDGRISPMIQRDSFEQKPGFHFRDNESPGGVPLGHYPTSRPREDQATGVSIVQNHNRQRRKQSAYNNRRESQRGSHRGGRSQHSLGAPTQYNSASRGSRGYIDPDKPAPDAEDVNPDY